MAGDLSTQLAEALAACELLRQEFTILIDQVQEFYTSTEDEVDFTRPDGVTIQIPSLDKIIRDFEAFQASAIAFYSPLLGAAARIAENPDVIFDRFIDTTLGDDVNDGLTPGTSWKTLKKAFQELRSGFRLNRIFLKAGETYVMDIDDQVALAQAQVNIVGAHDGFSTTPATTIIDCSDMDFTARLALGNKNGVFAATVGSVFSMAGFTFRCPYYDDGGNNLVHPVITALPACRVELLDVFFEVGSNVDFFDGPGQNNNARAFINVNGGALAFQGGGMDGGGSQFANGIAVNAGGHIVAFNTTIENCQKGVNDQELGRPGGTYHRSSVTFNNNVTDFDFNSDFPQLAVSNF